MQEVSLDLLSPDSDLGNQRMDTVIAAGVAEAGIAMAHVVVVTTIGIFVMPVLRSRRSAARTFFRRGATSMNAIAPDALIFEGGMAVA